MPRARVHGDFTIDGVSGPVKSAARVALDFLEPGGAATGKLFPTGNRIDMVRVRPGEFLTVLIPLRTMGLTTIVKFCRVFVINHELRLLFASCNVSVKGAARVNYRGSPVGKLFVTGNRTYKVCVHL